MHIRNLIAPLVFAACLISPAAAAEKWAAPVRLPDGLTLWLDAARLKDAWQAHGRSLSTGNLIDVWYDASGQALDLVQRGKGAQPRFIDAGAHAAVSFDGQQWLGATGLKESLDSFTLFLVAAPRSNTGDFRCFFAVNETGRNDYSTGFNIDQGPGGTGRFSVVNAEGRGFGGIKNLMTGEHSFGEFRLLDTVCQPGPGGIKLFVDGKPAGQRDRAAGSLSMNQITLAGRCYSNSDGPPTISGMLDGDVAEVLLFRRALSDAERMQVEDYLTKKHAGIDKAIAGQQKLQGHLVQTVPNPPVVQFLVPGFTVKELPVELPNINNVRYREDGKLVALGYNGNIYLLSDSKKTGLEDKVELFYENKGSLRSPIGMALTPKGYAKGQGVFVACKGKVVLIVDTDGDGKADKEIVVAQGWKELPHGVDALGVALDKDNNVYFGLGCADFTNAYQKTGDKSLFDIKSERGTIQKVSADFQKRETICTGIRFSVGMAFNKAGDLFCTDQEGATWLPNGNPLDELLHIQPGRHYGFPPRHPKYLPNVVDEPSTFDYGPQHQSTCGLCFNEGVNGGPIFGPAHWAGDAIVCGESRGKLYRTKLVKTAQFSERRKVEGDPLGYVAQTQLLACLQMLTIDACVSPGGELVIACHSGQPDWGTGPQGKGKLFKVIYSDRKAPQPALAWSSGPNEVRIAFDKPLDPLLLKDLTKQIKIERGVHVRPGDRFETLHPPYAVVKNQMATPRFSVPVYGVQVTSDRRTLVLSTGPVTDAVHYAITLPRWTNQDKAGSGEVSQLATVDLGFDLCGIDATWEGTQETRRIWLPHPILEVSREMTRGSSEHEAFWEFVDKVAKLTMNTKLNLWNMIRPALQPGTKLDYTLPEEEVELHLITQGTRFKFKIDASTVIKILGRNGISGRDFFMEPKELEPNRAEIVLESDGYGPLALRVYHWTNLDRHVRPLALHRFLLPWATMKANPDLAQKREIPQIQGGSWTKGKAIFFSDQAQCSRCHQIAGQGGKIGPDLGNLIHRDYDSVLRDIRFPSVAINPDHLAYFITLKDGRSLTGTMRSEGKDTLMIGTSEGKEVAIKRDDIDASSPSPISIMPDGLDKKLSADELRDLMTFLLTEPLQPAPIKREGAPPPRKQAEVDAIMKSIERPKGPFKKLHVVLAAGPKDHGVDEHDYPLWQRRWLELLLSAPDVKVGTAMGWPSEEQWKSADVMVFFSHHAGWSADKAKDLDAFLERGGGLVYLHWAVAGKEAPEVLAKRIGLAAKNIKFRHGPLELTFDPKHPISRGFTKVNFVDESYWNMTGDPERIQVFGTGIEEGKARPLFWTREQGKGRVYVCILGHYNWTFDDPLFRLLVLRGMAWTAREPVDRLSDLATVGARIEK